MKRTPPWKGWICWRWGSCPVIAYLRECGWSTVTKLGVTVPANLRLPNSRDASVEAQHLVASQSDSALGLQTRKREGCPNSSEQKFTTCRKEPSERGCGLRDQDRRKVPHRDLCLVEQKQDCPSPRRCKSVRPHAMLEVWCSIIEMIAR